MKATVINLSHPHYNLGAKKLVYWLRSEGWDVVEQGLGEADLVCLSAIFSWDVPKGAEIAKHYRNRSEIWAGGPGFMELCDWFEVETSIRPHWGLDWRFELQRGDYRMIFAARGCPVGCHFCGVTKWEGADYKPDYGFDPRPILCDNNLTDEPGHFQDFIVRRYQETGTPLLDANSGFEPTNFAEDVYQRWKPILRGPWRFGYDYLPERSAVKRMMEVLREEPRKKKRVYVLIGNEPFDACLQRATEVIEWGGEPYCQPFLRKDVLDRHDYVIKYDWTRDKLTHFARYFNRFLWKYTPLEEYRCGTKNPFAIVTQRSQVIAGRDPEAVTPENLSSK